MEQVCPTWQSPETPSRPGPSGRSGSPPRTPARPRPAPAGARWTAARARRAGRGATPARTGPRPPGETPPPGNRTPGQPGMTTQHADADPVDHQRHERPTNGERARRAWPRAPGSARASRRASAPAPSRRCAPRPSRADSRRAGSESRSHGARRESAGVGELQRVVSRRQQEDDARVRVEGRLPLRDGLLRHRFRIDDARQGRGEALQSIRPLQGPAGLCVAQARRSAVRSPVRSGVVVHPATPLSLTGARKPPSYPREAAAAITLARRKSCRPATDSWRGRKLPGARDIRRGPTSSSPGAVVRRVRRRVPGFLEEANHEGANHASSSLRRAAVVALGFRLQATPASRSPRARSGVGAGAEQAEEGTSRALSAKAPRFPAFFNGVTPGMTVEEAQKRSPGWTRICASSCRTTTRARACSRTTTSAFSR